MIKDGDGNALAHTRNVTVRWKEYFEKLMNEENKRVEEVTVVDQEVTE